MTDSSPNSMRRGDWFGLLTLALGVALVVVDISIVDLILPPIAQDLDLGFAQLQWVVALFPLVVAALVIPAGRAGDRRGARGMYLAGFSVFIVASLLAALAPGFGVLVAARALQGVGAAATLTCSLAVINATYVSRARETAFIVYGTAFAVAGALGPLVGGLIADASSWRWAFGVNVFVAPFVIFGVLRLVPRSVGRGTGGNDYLGTGLLSAGLALLTFGVIEGRTYGWFEAGRSFELGPIQLPVGGLAPTPIAFGVGTLTLLLFALIQRRRSRADKATTIDPRLARIPSFIVGSAVTLVVALGEFGLLFLIPLELQAGQGLDAAQVRLLLLPTALGSLAGAPLAAALVARRGPRASVQVGLVLEIVGLVLTSLAFGTEPLLLLPGLTLYGIGIGMAIAQLTGLVLSDVPPDLSGQASGVASAFRQLGSTLGVSLLGVVFAASLASTGDALAKDVETSPPTAALLQSLDEEPVQVLAALRSGTLPGVGSDVVERAEDGLAQATRLAGLLAAAFLTVGLLASPLLPARKKPEPYDEGLAETESARPASSTGPPATGG